MVKQAAEREVSFPPLPPPSPRTLSDKRSAGWAPLSRPAPRGWPASTALACRTGLYGKAIGGGGWSTRTTAWSKRKFLRRPILTSNRHGGGGSGVILTCLDGRGGMNTHPTTHRVARTSAQPCWTARRAGCSSRDRPRRAGLEGAGGRRLGGGGDPGGGGPGRAGWGGPAGGRSKVPYNRGGGAGLAPSL